MFVLVLMILASTIDYIEPSSSNDLRNDVEKYYESDTVRTMRKLWDEHRQPIEHALAKALLETIGKDGSNVFTLKPSNLKLCNSFYGESETNGNSVELLLMNLYLSQLPNCLLPDVMFSLSSNILKFQCTLTKLIVNAEYLVIRNDSKLVDDEKELKGGTQFLLREIPSRGKITLLMDNCILNGYTIARIKDAAVKLGYLKLELPNCWGFDTEIYGDGLRGRPLKTFKDIGIHFDLYCMIREYILKLLRNEFATKLQGMMFSYINTTAIFGHSLRKYEQEQEAIFLQVSRAMTKALRDMNKKILRETGGAFDLPEYHNSLQMEAANNEPRLLLPRYRNISLTKLVLTGLDTSYSTYTGGPIKIDKIGFIGAIRFRKLQVRGALYLNEGDNSQKHQVSAELSDLWIEIDRALWLSFRVSTDFVPQLFISMDMKNFIEAYLKFAANDVLYKRVFKYTHFKFY